MQPPWPRDMTGDEDAFSPPGVCGPFTGGACSLLLGGQRSVSTPFLLWLLSNLNSKYHYSRAAYLGATCHRTHQRGFPWPLRGWLWKSNAFVQGNTPWEMQSAQEQRVVPIQTWPFPKHSAPFPAFRALPHTPAAGKSLTACDPPSTHLSPAKAQPECHVVPGTSQEPSTQCHTRMGGSCPYLLNSFLVQPLPVPQFTRTQYKTVPCIHSALSEYPDLTNSTSTNIMSKQNI